MPPAPPVDADVSGFELDRDVKRELSSLRAEAAEQTAKHLVMVARLIDTDPERAHLHAIAARRLAPRLGVVREAVGLAAYHAGLFADALSELRAARRISGGDEHWPVLADCERALGRPERALTMASAPEVEHLDRAGRVEMRIVAAGARADLGQFDAAVVTLQCPELNEDSPKPWSARLRYAYAEALVEAGRDEEGRAWFARAAEVDHDGLTPAEERCQELDGITFEFAEDDDEDDDLAADAASQSSGDRLTDLGDPRGTGEIDPADGVDDLRDVLDEPAVVAPTTATVRDAVVAPAAATAPDADEPVVEGVADEATGEVAGPGADEPTVQDTVADEAPVDAAGRDAEEPAVQETDEATGGTTQGVVAPSIEAPADDPVHEHAAQDVASDAADGADTRGAASDAADSADTLGPDSGADAEPVKPKGPPAPVHEALTLFSNLQ